MSKIPNSSSLKLHVGDFDATSPVMVKIYDQYNKLIHKEEINNAKGFSRVYNLGKTGVDYVNVRIENNGETKTFSHSLEQQ